MLPAPQASFLPRGLRKYTLILSFDSAILNFTLVAGIIINTTHHGLDSTPRSSQVPRMLNICVSG